MWRHFALALAVAACLFQAGCRRPLPNELVVGMELGYPPFEMTDTFGHPSGVSVDLAIALGQKLGRPVRIENMPFDGLIPALKTGKINLIISSMTANEARAKSIDFSIPYVHTGLSILAASGSPVKSSVDLNQPGRRIVVKKGTTGHNYAVEHLPLAQVLVLDQESACVLEVTQGKADAFVYDQISILQNWEKNKDTTRALLEPFQRESWAIGVRKGDDALRNEVDVFLAGFKREGGFEQLAQKYLSRQRAVFRQLGYPFFFDEP